MPQKNKKEFEKRGKLFWYAGLGIDLVVSSLVGGVIGYLLDSFFSTTPWLMIVFLILGTAGGFLNIFRVLIREETKKKND